MARPIWTGAITFGLVSVPVAMYSATHEHEVDFHQFEKDTADRIRYRRVNERTGKEVGYDDIVKGADVGGDYVMLDQEELDSVAPGRSRSLEIDRFVELDAIDPLYYQKTYWLGPGNGDTGKVYGLLRDAMSDSGRAAIGTLVMRGKEYLTAIRADGNLLVLQTMFFADEVRDPKEQIDDLPRRNAAKPAEMHMAQQLIDSMAGPWRPADFRDTYTDRVNDLIKAKKAGNEVTPAPEAPEPTNASDLFEVLRRSVEAASRRQKLDATATSPSRAKTSGKTAGKPAKSANVPSKSIKAAAKKESAPARSAKAAKKQSAPAKSAKAAAKEASARSTKASSRTRGCQPSAQKRQRAPNGTATHR